MTMRVPIVPILLVVNTGMIVFALTLVLSRGEPEHQVNVRLEPALSAETQPASEPAVTSAAIAPPALVGVVRSDWAQAETLRQNDRFADAMLQYADLAAREPSPAVRSLLLYRQGQCLIALDRTVEARRQLVAASESPAAVIRGLARLELASLDAADRLNFDARRRAYGALAVEAACRPKGFEQACDVVIARSLVDQALVLCNFSDKASGGSTGCVDPFAGKSPDEAHKLLLASCHDEKPSALDVSISVLKQRGPGRLEIQCDRAPLEDFLGRLASATGTKFRWASEASSDARKRLVSLCGVLNGSMRAAEIACGQAGLVARFTGDQVVVYDPDAATTESQRRDLICREAFSSWRRLLLRHPDPASAAPGHLMLGMLYEAMGQATSALSEYRYIPQAYPRESASAEALLRCGRLRMSLLDYAGARRDLLEMLDRYPDHAEMAHVYLSLAECDLRLGNTSQACKLYMRLYGMDVSGQARQTASLGAARCLYTLKRYAKAANWIERYLRSAHGTDNHGRAQAWILLARCHSETNQAGRAIAELRNALAEQMPESDRVEMLLDLSEALAAGQQCGRALVVIGNLDSERLSGDQLHRYVVARAKLYQRSGLEAKAAGILRRQMDHTDDPARRALLGVELAKCRIAAGDFKDARAALVEAVGKLSAGPEARSAVCLLAEVCLSAKRYEQAMAVARPLVRAEESEIRARANKVLAKAHLARKQYEQAAGFLAAASQTGDADK